MTHDLPFAEPAAFSEASALIESFGDHAGLEARSRASRSRGLGNFVHFCRWREVERMIALLQADEVAGSVH